MKGGKACWVSDRLSSPLPQLLAFPGGGPALRLCGSSCSHCPGRCPFSIQGGMWLQGVIGSFCLLPDLQLPPGGVLAPRALGDPVFPARSAPPGPQVNMLIGIIVFNKLMARDGVSDKSKKQRAG